MSTTPSDVPIEELLAEREWLTRLARGLCGRLGDADDLVQESYRVALERPPHPGGSIRGWLFRVTTNLFRERLRRDRAETRRRPRAATPAVPLSADELAERLELQREISRLVLDLPEDSRTVVLLRYWEDLTPAEIAKRLELPGGTVRSRLKRSMDRLRADLDARTRDGRNAWVSAMLPLLLLRDGPRPITTAPLLAAGVLTMSLKAKIVSGVVFLAVATTGILVLSPAGETPPAPPPEVAGLAPPPLKDEQPPIETPPIEKSPAAATAATEPEETVPVEPPDLEQKLTFKTGGTLGDALDNLAEQLGVPVTAPHQLRDRYCTLSTEELPLKNILALLAMMAGAEWHIEGGGIAFTPKDSRPAPTAEVTDPDFSLPRIELLRPLPPVPAADVIIYIDRGGALSVEYPAGSSRSPAGTDHVLWLLLRHAARDSRSALIRADGRAPAGALFAALRGLCASGVGIGTAALAVTDPQSGEAVLDLPLLKAAPNVHMPFAAPRLAVYLDRPQDKGSLDPADLDRWCAHLRKYRAKDGHWCAMSVAGGVSIKDVAILTHRIRSRGVAVAFDPGSDISKRGPARFYCLNPALPKEPMEGDPAAVVATPELPTWAAQVASTLALKSGPPTPISGRPGKFGLRDHHGGEKTEQAVRKCLNRLTKAQRPDGSMGAGAVRTTATAALALLGSSPPGAGRNGKAAEKALTWLASLRNSAGGFAPTEAEDAETTDALVAMAFVEAAAWRPENYSALAQVALAGIEERWRSGGAEHILSALPLSLAPIAGLPTDPRATAAVEKRLARVGNTPEEILVRIWRGEDPRTSEAIATLLKSLRAEPETNWEGDLMAPAFRALALFQIGGPDWITLNQGMWDVLLVKAKDGDLEQTAWKAIALQTYYRYLPVTSYFR